MKINHYKNPTEIRKFIGDVNKVTFFKNGETFSFSDKLEIRIDENNQYIKFIFTSMTDSLDIYDKPIRETFIVSKFEIAEHYKLNSPTVLNNINFYLYINFENIFDNTRKIGLFDVRDAIFDNVLPFERYSYSIIEVLILDIPSLVSKIIETGVWELINQK